MESLLEKYWNIDHQCNEDNISLCDESIMLHHAAEEYVEELLKHDDRWKSIILNDIDNLKASSFIRRTQKGYSEGAELFLSYLHHELERYGLRIDDREICSEGEINKLPPDMNGIFKTLDEYKSFINDCKSLHWPKQIVERLMDCHISLDKGNVLVLHKHLTKRGIIKVEYSYFCRLIRVEKKA